MKKLRMLSGMGFLSLALLVAAAPSRLFAADADVALPSVAATNWMNIGGTFGKSNEFQFGVNKMGGLGGCVVDERFESQFLSGPCIDPFAIKFKGDIAFTLGGGVLYNAEHGNATYNIQPGFVIGPIMGAALLKTSERVPFLANLANINPPQWVQYIGKITHVYISLGYRPSSSADISHVCRQKTGLPFDCTGGAGVRFDGDDAVSYAAGLVKSGLGYGPNGGLSKMESAYLPPKLALLDDRVNPWAI